MDAGSLEKEIDKMWDGEVPNVSIMNKARVNYKKGIADFMVMAKIVNRAMERKAPKKKADKSE